MSVAERGTEGGWTSASIGAPWQHRIFYRLIALGGQRAAAPLLFCVVLFYVLFRPALRRQTFFYLRRRFPRDNPPRLGASLRMIHAFGKVLVDRAVVGIRGPHSMRVTMEGGERLLACVGEGRGLLLVTAHVGCWQVAMSALEFLQVPVHLLMQREDGDIDRHYFEHKGLPCPHRIIDPRGFHGGALAMLDLLKKGEILAVMGDRMRGSDKNGVWVDFLGAPLRFPFSAYKLAAATGAAVAVVFSVKTGAADYLLKVYDTFTVPGGLGRAAADYAGFAARFSGALERFCAEHPYDFFNFFDLWQQPDEALTRGPGDNKEQRQWTSRKN